MGSDEGVFGKPKAKKPKSLKSVLVRLFQSIYLPYLLSISKSVLKSVLQKWITLNSKTLFGGVYTSCPCFPVCHTVHVYVAESGRIIEFWGF